MNNFNGPYQKGVATMFVTMVLLILITLMVVTAFSISTVNLKTVGNVQVRKEAMAAADWAIDQAIDTTFWNPAVAIPSDIDIDNDGADDYQVVIDPPVCIRFTRAAISTASSVTLPGFSAVDAWNTIWVLDATSTSDVSGARVRVRQGVRVLMSEADKDLYCDV